MITQLKKLNWRVWVVVVLTLANFLVWLAVWQNQPTNKLTISFLDVGQGDAIFIESPTGGQMLIDGGPAGRLAAPLAKVMPWYDRSIDLLMVTNPDSDHFAGFIDVLRRFKVGTVMEPGTISTTATYQELERMIKTKKVPDRLARRGQVIDLGGGATIRIIFPDQDVSGLKINDGSIVAQLNYGSTSVMLTGDTTAKMEQYIAGLEGTNLRSTILKVAHHGSKTSSSEEFLRAVSPNLAIISAGLNNRYGHPHAEVLDRLNALHIKILRTEDFDHQKTITLVSDGFQFVER